MQKISSKIIESETVYKRFAVQGSSIGQIGAFSLAVTYTTINGQGAANGYLYQQNNDNICILSRTLLRVQHLCNLSDT